MNRRVDVEKARTRLRTALMKRKPPLASVDITQIIQEVFGD